jgi:hypothetical protein
MVEVIVVVVVVVVVVVFVFVFVADKYSNDTIVIDLRPESIMSIDDPWQI